MSRIRELRLHGFKTFAEPTRFEFGPGVTAVIGPNGSGKSNMADAIRWVLGEQSNRSLRTRRADEVIFAGSQARRPLGMAEAALTLDNADGWLPIDYAEVTIARRAYRSGENEYLLNGTRVRLRDVTDLLAAGRLGASDLVVVGQGTVDAALSLRPEERRQLFEEAAGVKALQVRKNEALSRLRGSHENLARLRDLLGELRPRVRRLGLQAKHQQEHDLLAGRARALAVEWHRRRESEARVSLGDAARRAAAADAALEALRSELESGRERLREAEAAYWQTDAAARVAAGQREAAREEAIRAETAAASLAERMAESDARLDAATREMATLDSQAADAARAEPADELAARVAETAAAEERWRASVTELSTADAALIAAEETLAAERQRHAARLTEHARGEDAHRRALGRAEQLRRDLATADASRADADAALAAALQREAAIRGERDAALARLDRAIDALLAARTARDRARADTAAAKQRAEALGAELAAERARADQFGTLAAALEEAGWRPLRDLLEVPGEAWAAVEAALGADLERALAWRDADPAAPAGDARGDAHLVAAGDPGGEQTRAAALRAVGARGTLADLVAGSDLPAALHATAIAPSLEALLTGWRRLPVGWAAVTLEGDLADARGRVVVRGRADQRSAEAARRRERRAELEAAIEAAGLEQRTLADAHRETEAMVEAAAAERARAAQLFEGAERDWQVARGAADAARATVERRRREAGDLAAELQRTEAVLAGAERKPRTAVAAVERLPLEDAAAEARRRRAVAAAERDAAQAAWQAARAVSEALELATAGQRQARADAEARLRHLTAELPGLRAAIEGLRAELAAARERLDAARAAEAAATAARDGADAERDRRRAALLDREREASGAGGRLAELERDAQAAAAEASRREEALAAVGRERDLALEGLPEGGDDTAGDAAALDAATLEQELRSTRRTLAQLGSVNPFAVEEHRELSERADALGAQEEDLARAIASTESLIAELEREIAARFNAAFAAIGERFDEFVQLLFAGGSAELQLAEGDDGESRAGVEIVVRPPGKRLQRLAMLSGGERALTGVALLFAMLSVNPVPFCVLDEVDAALDEANIGRFAQALRRLAERIDFVVVTHNRATIETADTIYGVTMTDAAVSKVISLRLADVALEAAG